MGNMRFPHVSSLTSNASPTQLVASTPVLASLYSIFSVLWPARSRIHSSNRSQAAFHTAAGSAAVEQDQHAALNHPQPSSLTEEQLADLFDEELQQRLAAAAHKASAQAHSPAAATQEDPSTTTGSRLQQQEPSTVSVSTSSNSSTSTWSAQQQAARAWQPPGPTVRHPLMSSDPWAPLPPSAQLR